MKLVFLVICVIVQTLVSNGHYIYTSGSWTPDQEPSTSTNNEESIEIEIEIEIEPDYETENLSFYNPVYTDHHIGYPNERRDRNPTREEQAIGTTVEEEYVLLYTKEGSITVTKAKGSSLDIIKSCRLENTTCNVAKIIAIANDQLYVIDTLIGIIFSTDAQAFIKGENCSLTTEWNRVGSFSGVLKGPKGRAVAGLILYKYVLPGLFGNTEEREFVYNSAGVNGSYIYFVTITSVLYKYDTSSQMVTKIAELDTNDSRIIHSYASLIVVENILYIQIGKSFYSFDGTNLNRLTPPTGRHQCALIKYQDNGNYLNPHVCLIGGIITDKENISTCYNPMSESWEYVDEVSLKGLRPVIAPTKNGTFFLHVLLTESLLDSLPKDYVLQNGGFSNLQDHWIDMTDLQKDFQQAVQAATFSYRTEKWASENMTDLTWADKEFDTEE